MRNTNRIRPFLNKIEKIWLKHPHLRFGQLIEIINHSDVNAKDDMFYIEDKDFEKLIDKFSKKIK